MSVAARLYRVIIRHIQAQLSTMLLENQISLAMMITVLWRCLCLMVSVYYKSRALPLAWVTYKGRKGHSSQQTQLQLFKRVKAILPADVPVVLVGMVNLTAAS